MAPTNYFPTLTWLWRNIKSGRLPLIALTILLALFLPIVVALHVDAYLLRYRSERLLGDMQSVELRKTTFAEAQRMFQKWGVTVGEQDKCDGNNCTLMVDLSGFIVPHVVPHLGPRAALIVERGRLLVGTRLALIRAWVRIRRGVVWDKGVSVFVEAPPENHRDRMLWGGASTVSRFYTSTVERPEVAMQDTLIHSDYLVGQGMRYANEDTPQFLVEVPAIWAEFTPYADPADVRRLMQFNLACLTSWRSCRTGAELMPAAWAQYLEDRPRLTKALESHQCTPQTLESLGRDAENAAIVRVIANRTDTDDDKTFNVATVRLEERVKAAAFWKVGSDYDVRLFRWALAMPSDDTLLRLPQGKRFILLFNRLRRHPIESGIWLYPCGAVPWSATSVAVVRRGIGRDSRANDPDLP